MSSLTTFDAQVLPAKPRHLYEVKVELAGRQEEVRVKAEGRFEAIALVMESRPGWTFRTVSRYIAGRMVPA